MTTSNQFHIFIFEDSTPISDTLRAYLSRNEDKIDSFKISGQEAKKLVKQQQKKMSPDPLEDYEISLFNGKQDVQVQANKILYLKVDHVYTEVYLDDGQKIVQRGSLTQILDQLPQEYFVQTHRSFAINLSKVDDWRRSSIQMEGINIPISRTRKKEVIEILEEQFKASFAA